MRRGAGPAFAILLVAIVGAPRASACSCAPPPSTPQALASAVSVFSGKAVAMALDADEAYVRVTFHVSGVWKGKDDAFQTYSTLRELCGFPMVLGGEYLVYVDELEDGRSIFSQCSRSKKLASAAEDLAVLGVPSKPRETDLQARARESEAKAEQRKRAVMAMASARTLAEALRLSADLPGKHALAFARSKAGCGTWGFSFGFEYQVHADARAWRECENQRGPQMEEPCALVPVGETKLALPETPSCFNVEGPIER